VRADQGYKPFNVMNLNYIKSTVELRSEIIDFMCQVRSKISCTTISPDIAKGSEVWEGRLDGHKVNRVIIYLRSSGCTWAIAKPSGAFQAGCFECEHGIAGTTLGIPIAPQSYIAQFLNEYNKYDFSDSPILCLYNEGSFFNPHELPVVARQQMLKVIAGNKNIRKVIIESLPAYITPDVVVETTSILGNKEVEIAVGLESSNPLVRDLCINKPFTLEQFCNVIPIIKQKCNLLTYVLLKPGFLTEKEALDDAQASVDYAFEHGADVVSIEPVSIGQHHLSGMLNKIGRYRPAWLWTVIDIITHSHHKGIIRVGGFQFEPKYTHHAQNCPLCNAQVTAALTCYNATNDITVLESLDCHCKQTWREELDEVFAPLPERIAEVLPLLRETL
jgi:archaeosine synthase beta-subunit